MRAPILKIIFVLCFVNISAIGQTAYCVHGTGIPYLLDAFLGSLGACNCEKSPIYLNNFPDCNNNPYKIEFEDDFSGTKLDTSKWEIQPWGQGALSTSANMEFNSLDNVTIRNGICYITAKKETLIKRAINWKSDTDILTDGLPNLRTYNYTSSNLWTKDKFFHGKYEIKCRMPKGNGFWPAFWMFGGKRWNEIDVFDSYSGTDKLVTSIGHDFEDNGKSNGCNAVKQGFDLSEWHRYACVFDFDKISFLLDDELIRVIHRVISINGDPVNCGDKIGTGTYYQLKSYPIERMSIVMNLALTASNAKGSFVPVDDSTPFPSSLEVDYVRKWSRDAFVETISVDPNPTNGMFSIISNVQISEWKIYNIDGKIIYNGAEISSPHFIDLSSINDGIYFIKAKVPNGFKTCKFIKLSQ